MAEADRRRTGTTGTDRADRTRRGPGQGATVLAALLAAGACAGPAAATDIRLPALSEPCWSTESGLHRSLLLTAPDWTAETVPVLTFSARVESASPTGAVYALRLLINDLPVNQGFAHPRLLNKPAHFPANGPGSGAPWFKRTGLGYGIRENQAWLVPCAASFDDPATAYAIDLEGLVQPNRTFKLTLSAYTPNRKGTRRRDTLGEAALVLTPPKLALRPRPEVDALRAALMPPPVLTLAAAPLMTAPGAADANRPRELANPDRPPDPPATVTFEQLEGWRLESLDATNVTFASSAERVLRRAATAAVTFPAGAEMRLLLKPPAPIELPAPFDTLHLWYGGAIKERYFADAADIAGTVLLEDARGHRQAVDLGILRTEYYGLALGRLSAAQRAALEPPLRLRGIGLEVINSPVRQPLYLESLACFTDTHAPLADPYLPEEPVLPHRPEGLTPDPPADTRYAATLADGIGTLQSVGGGRRLASRNEPPRGKLPGNTARRRDTPPVAPSHGGGTNGASRSGDQSWLDSSLMPYSPTIGVPGSSARRRAASASDDSATERPLNPPVTITTEPAGRSTGASARRTRSANANAVPGTNTGSVAARSAAHAPAASTNPSGVQ